MAGMTAIEACVGDYIFRDMKRLMPAVFLVVILCLWLSFRRVLGVLLPLLTVVVSILWTMGVMSLCHVPLTALSGALPVLLIAVGTAYTIHILFHFLHNASQTTDRKEALVRSVSQVGYAVIMAGGRGERFWPLSRARASAARPCSLACSYFPKCIRTWLKAIVVMGNRLE